MTIITRHDTDLRHVIDAKRDQAIELRQQGEAALRQARALENEARKLQREWREHHTQRQQQHLQTALAQTDMTTRYDEAACLAIVRQHILDPRPRIGQQRHIDKYDHIIYAILRGKPWDGGLCPNTRHFLPDGHLDPLHHHCARRLAKRLARDFLQAHPELDGEATLRLPENRYPRRIRWILEDHIAQALDLKGYFAERIQDSDKLYCHHSRHQGAAS